MQRQCFASLEAHDHWSVCGKCAACRQQNRHQPRPGSSCARLPANGQEHCRLLHVAHSPCTAAAQGLLNKADTEGNKAACRRGESRAASSRTGG